MGKLVEMRGMGGEVSSVVCKNTQTLASLSLGSLRGQQHAMGKSNKRDSLKS